METVKGKRSGTFDARTRFLFFFVLQSESDLLCGLRSSRLVFNPFPNSSLLLVGREKLSPPHTQLAK